MRESVRAAFPACRAHHRILLLILVIHQHIQYLHVTKLYVKIKLYVKLYVKLYAKSLYGYNGNIVVYLNQEHLSSVPP